MVLFVSDNSLKKQETKKAFVICILIWGVGGIDREQVQREFRNG